MKNRGPWVNHHHHHQSHKGSKHKGIKTKDGERHQKVSLTFMLLLTKLISSRNSWWVRDAATSCCNFCHNWSLLKHKSLIIEIIWKAWTRIRRFSTLQPQGKKTGLLHLSVIYLYVFVIHWSMYVLWPFAKPPLTPFIGLAFFQWKR